jgi:glycosyltransferase involved in cell wall biosynthesis
MKLPLKIAIIGTVGLPASYGGFETLADNLVRYFTKNSMGYQITVYCSSKSYPLKNLKYYSADLVYIRLNANGIQSALYDICSLFSAISKRHDVILILGVSGAILLPLVRLISTAHIITNIDGIEWRRKKWGFLAKCFLRFSEKIAVRFSHDVIADNHAISEYVKQTYSVDAIVIAYGGDHAVSLEARAVSEYELPERYVFSVCRIEPENNLHIILEAFAKMPEEFLVIVGNWNNSDYGKLLRVNYSSFKNLYLLDPIFDLGKLKKLRSNSTMYVHGHSAGGTNPSLVEAMHFGKVILAFDCDYNRSTTENKAIFFKNVADLIMLVQSILAIEAKTIGDEMLEIAKRRYTWEIVAKEYFDLLHVKNNVI